MAKDGRPYDIDNIAGEIGKDEVEVIQFMRPDGRRRRMIAPVGEEAAKKADSLILSAEQLMNGQIVLYARKIGEMPETEKSEFAEVGPGVNSPAEVLKRLIIRVSERKSREGG